MLVTLLTQLIGYLLAGSYYGHDLCEDVKMVWDKEECGRTQDKAVGSGTFQPNCICSCYLWLTWFLSAFHCTSCFLFNCHLCKLTSHYTVQNCDLFLHQHVSLNVWFWFFYSEQWLTILSLQVDTSARNWARASKRAGTNWKNTDVFRFPVPQSSDRGDIIIDTAIVISVLSFD